MHADGVSLIQNATDQSVSDFGIFQTLRYLHIPNEMSWGEAKS